MKFKIVNVDIDGDEYIEATAKDYDGAELVARAYHSRYNGEWRVVSNNNILFSIGRNS